MRSVFGIQLIMFGTGTMMSFKDFAGMALSLIIAAAATLLAPFLTPVFMKVLAGFFLEIHLLDMMWDMMKMVILPLGLGLVFNEFLGKRTKSLEKVIPLVSMFGIAFMIIIGTALGRDSLLTVGRCCISRE